MNETIGRNIINTNRFMSVATTSYYNDVWIAPVYYVSDKNYNLYFVSQMRSRHVIHIIMNNQVAVSIFDSTQEEDPNGIQIKGVVDKLSESKYQEVISLFYKKDEKEVTPKIIADKIKEYKDNERAIFQIKPTEVYIQDKEYFKEHRVDKRIPIKLI